MRAEDARHGIRTGILLAIDRLLRSRPEDKEAIEVLLTLLSEYE